MKIKDGSFVILFKDETRTEIFLIYRSDWPIWNLPGGGIEANEDPETASARETLEETGFKIKITNKLGQYIQYQPGSKEPLNTVHTFEARFVSGKYQPEFPGCRGEWFEICRLPIDITDKTREKILDAVNFSGKYFTKTAKRAQVRNNLHLLIRHPLAAYRYFTRK